MTLIDVQEVSKHFSELVERLEKGEEAIIQKDNEPFAKLSPSQKPNGLGSLVALRD